MHGLLILDKPRGPTCQQILSRFRRIFPKTKVGYTGTLDPFATGVLPIFIGEATKLIPFIQEDRKVYEATLKLGEGTETLDSEGKVTQTSPVPQMENEKVEQVLSGFLGKNHQTPPKFSAIKVNGTPLYKLARKGIPVDAKPRPIEVFSIRMLEWQSPLIKFVTEVSRGTYIRSLALDFSKALGTIGHLTQLRRLKSGPFFIEESLPWNQCEVYFNNGKLFEIINKNNKFINNYFKCFPLKDNSLKNRLLQGQTIPVEGEMGSEEKQNIQERETLLVHDGREALALSQWILSEKDQKAYLKPLRILRLPLI